MARDLTKTLDAAEVVRLRALLAEQPPFDPSAGGQPYPRMLYHASYFEAQKAWRENPDEMAKKLSAEKMKVATVIVFDADEEVGFLEDGWRKSPADFMEIDPRIPVGREAKRAAVQQAMTREQEIQNLKLRLAELMGAPAARVASDVPQPEQTRDRLPPPRRRKIRRPSRVKAARQSIADALGDPPEAPSQS